MKRANIGGLGIHFPDDENKDGSRNHGLLADQPRDASASQRKSQGRFTHSVLFPCRAHAIQLPCHVAKGLECVFPIWFTQCGCVWFTLAMPCPCHAPTMPSSQRHITARPSRDGRAVLWPWEERHGRSMAWAWHGKCESDTAALCESNGKDTF